VNPPDKKQQGCFIVIEGADGCGKTTHAELLCKHLRRAGRPVLLAREPGGTGIGEAIREMLLNPAHHAMSMPTELMLYMACRGQLTHEAIKPALAEGKCVVCDRYLLSSVVYQGFAAGLGVEAVWEMGVLATENLEPDVQVVLDVSYENACRRRSRESDRIEARGEAFHRKVIQGYREVARDVPSTHIVDANRSMDDVQRDIQRIVDAAITEID